MTADVVAKWSGGTLKNLTHISTLHVIAAVAEVIVTRGKLYSSGTTLCSKKKPKRLYRQRGIKKLWHQTMKKHIDHIMYELRQDAKAFVIMLIAVMAAAAVIVSTM